MRRLSLPFDGAEVLLDSDTGCVSQVGQIPSTTLKSGAVVETPDNGRRAPEILHASGWSHVEVVAVDHVDLDLPPASDAIAIADDRQDHRVGAASTHVDVHCLCRERGYWVS